MLRSTYWKALTSAILVGIATSHELSAAHFSYSTPSTPTISTYSYSPPPPPPTPTISTYNPHSALTKTITIPYLGTTSTSTTLVPCSGPVTVVIETPLVIATCSSSSTSTTKTSSSSSTAAPTPSGKPLKCIAEGYISSTNKLLSYSLETGEYAQIATIQTESVNALAYNIQDDFLYGSNTTHLVRVHADGTIDALVPILGGYRADIDGDSYYWFANGSTIHQIDINPRRATYLKTISTAPVATNGVKVYDWAYIPVAGPYLYSVGTTTASGSTGLVRFSMVSKEWETIADYPNIRVDDGFGEHFGVNNGNFYALDDNTGDLWRFPVPLLGATEVPGQPEKIFGGGPVFKVNDGARCSLNTAT